MSKASLPCTPLQERLGAVESRKWAAKSCRQAWGGLRERREEGS